MSRLLLVDDNPSIHKIAETLLVRTGIELVCMESAAQALDLIKQGESFDVALLDTVMVGMDGWALLDEMRKIPATAGIPIAMMAGVLDTVDPARLQNAHIQGFLKKPVELRDLADRVRKLLETPVLPPPVPVAAPAPVVIQEPEEKPRISPFETMPATRLKDLPELRHLSQPAAAASVLPPAVPARPEPAVALSMESLEDLLELTDADLLAEEESPNIIDEMGSPEILDESSEEALDLEELDLDSLRELPPPAVQVGVIAAPVQPPAEDIPDLTPPEGFLPDLSDDLLETPVAAGQAILAEEAFPHTAMDLPDLGPMDENPFDLEISESLSSPAMEPELGLLEPKEEHSDLQLPAPPPMDDFTFDMTEDSDSLLGSLEPAPAEVPEPVMPPVAKAIELPEPEPFGFEDSGAAPGTSTEILQIEMEEPQSEEDLEYLEETLSGIGVEIPRAATASALVLDTHEEATAPGRLEDEPTAEFVPISLPEAAIEAPSEVLPVAPPVVPMVLPEAEPAAPAVVAKAAVEPVSPPSLLPAEATAAQHELLAALLADSMLMEALSKAVVARLGDKVLREIAWEVIPELSERIPNQ